MRQIKPDVAAAQQRAKRWTVIPGGYAIGAAFVALLIAHAPGWTLLVDVIVAPLLCVLAWSILAMAFLHRSRSDQRPG